MENRFQLRLTQPLIHWVTEATSISLGVNRQGLEADHSPPTSAQVKKTRIYTSTPSYVFVVGLTRTGSRFIPPPSRKVPGTHFCYIPKATRGLEPISYRGALRSTLLHATV
jgi:hypothetical protein